MSDLIQFHNYNLVRLMRDFWGSIVQITCGDVGKWVAAGDATLSREGGTFGRLHCALGGGQLGSPAPQQMHQASIHSCSVASRLQPHLATAAAFIVHAKFVSTCTKGVTCMLILQAAGKVAPNAIRPPSISGAKVHRKPCHGSGGSGSPAR